MAALAQATEDKDEMQRTIDALQTALEELKKKKKRRILVDFDPNLF